MAKLSVSAAARVYAVSRPTIQKHLKNGKISGEKDADNHWQIDTSELNRLYTLREAGAVATLPEALTKRDTPLDDDLKAEIEVLKARLEAAEAMAEERGKRLDQLMPLLAPSKRRKWRFW
jgi:hypothetical protein|tara:strand:- start:491 stop:850 length:360 start_codon:yes stop_codon:yes gene_type:complete